MNILIIEDDIFLADKMKTLFNKKKILNRVKTLNSYNDFLRELVVIKSYDIILVDIILGKETKKTGIDIINIIRREDKCIPIIIISGLDDMKWLENGFDVGASDYIIKPFRFRELEIRVYKWFKIYFYSDKANNYILLDYYGLTYDIEENEFYFEKEKIILTKGNKYLLSILISNKEKILTERYLIEKIWGDIGFVIERNLRVVILRLKQSLKIYGIDNWVKNIRGEGYILKK